MGLSFDMTLTSSPMDDNQDSSWMPTVFGGQPRIDALNAFLKTVKREGCWVLVLSWHPKSLINRALESIGLLSFIDHIYDREALEKKGPPEMAQSKAMVMKEVLGRLGLHGGRCVFVDNAIEEMEGMPCARYQVEGQHGMMQ